MSRHPLISHALRAVVWLACLSAPLHAQTIDDGILMARHELLTGNVYSHEDWDHYWEGTLKRMNGNIGTVTTKTNVWSAAYGLTDRLNLLATVPYVWTRASQGVLHGLQGFQDITVAAKYNFLTRSSSHYGALRAIAVFSAGIPLTDYNPELLPLSIGTHNSRVSGRFTANLQTNRGWYFNGSTSYTWRSGVDLDRPYFFTDDQFVESNRVDMPNAFDYVVSGGYMKRRLMTAVSLTQQRTLGGGDIRRQDMPFVSNQMNFSKVNAMVMHSIPKLTPLQFQVAYGYVLAGRNVGQANAFTVGLMYTFNGGAAR